MKQNIFAYTAPGPDYPEYISVNTTDDPDVFTVDVRHKRGEDGACGATAQVTLTREQLNDLAISLARAASGGAVA